MRTRRLKSRIKIVYPIPSTNIIDLISNGVTETKSQSKNACQKSSSSKTDLIGNVKRKWKSQSKKAGQKSSTAKTDLQKKPVNGTLLIVEKELNEKLNVNDKEVYVQANSANLNEASSSASKQTLKTVTYPSDNEIEETSSFEDVCEPFIDKFLQLRDSGMSSAAVEESVQHEVLGDSSRVLNVNTDTINGFNVEDELTSAAGNSSGKIMTEVSPSLMDYEDNSNYEDEETSSDTNRLQINGIVLKQNEAAENSCGKLLIEDAPSLTDYEDDSDHEDEETLSDTNRSQINKIVLNQNEASTANLANVMEPEELQCLSLIVHKWAKEECGSVKVLHKWKLDIRQMEEIVVFAGSDSKYSHLLNNLSAERLLYLWRKSGLLNQEGLHMPKRDCCPYQHCRTDPSTPLSPLDADSILVSPRNMKNARRNLFSKSVKEVTNKAGSERTFSKDTVNKLLRRIAYLEKEAKTKENKGHQPQSKTVNNLKDSVKLSQKTIILKCKVKDCEVICTSSVGMLKHQANFHKDEKDGELKVTCPFCSKVVKYIKKHIRDKHRDEAGATCDICKKMFKSVEITNHKRSCKSCPNKCGYFNNRKHRIRDHILRKCPAIDGTINDVIQNVDMPPVSLNSKFISDDIDTASDTETEDDSSLDRLRAMSDPLLKDKKSNDDIAGNIGDESLEENLSTDLVGPNFSICEENDSSNTKRPHKKNASDIPVNDLRAGRKCFPWDCDCIDGYLTEYEEGDEDEFTLERRMIKDDLEMECIKLDDLKNERIEGDNHVLNMFKEHLKKHNPSADTEGDNKQEPSTNGMYLNAIKRHLIPAYHKYVTPFDSRWFLDCDSEKPCKIEGVERSSVMLNDPVYISVGIIEKILNTFDKGEVGGQRCIFLAALPQWMNFIELHFNKRITIYGREVLDKILSYHSYVHSYLRSTKEWKKGKKERKKQNKENKIIKDFKVPDRDAKVLKKYRELLNSNPRLEEIKKLARLASPEVTSVTDSEFVRATRLVHGEALRSTGARPNVLNRLTNGGYSSAKPAFNPFKISEDDKRPIERNGKSTLYQRTNPNLPPECQACVHQIESKSAVCSENCPDRAVPDGYNIYVDWDKTRESIGDFYLHLAFEIKVMFDLYDIVKKKYFGDGKRCVELDENWLYDEATPFFLTCKGTHLSASNVDHLSKAMGIDVCSYDFRRIVCTWILCHELPEIRECEGDALQHNRNTAVIHYQLNKQVNPQRVAQQYIHEEGILTKEISEELRKIELKIRDEVLRKEQARKDLKINKLLKEKEERKEKQAEHRPLGPRHKILTSSRNRFVLLYSEMTGVSLKQLINEVRPLKWRNSVVRTVCSYLTTKGEELRQIWLSIYRGDLCYGVRDRRLEAKGKGWPVGANKRRRQKDRFSWIAFALYDSLQAQIMLEQKMTERANKTL